VYNHTKYLSSVTTYTITVMNPHSQPNSIRADSSQEAQSPSGIAENATLAQSPTQIEDAVARSGIQPAIPRLNTPGYHVLETIGAGGMGVVYKARNVETGELVALKTLPNITPSALLQFKREFRIAAGLSHPNLARLGQLVSHGSDWFLTMEFVEGVDFLAYVSGHPDELRNTFSQLATGLSALHVAGILHRDIKPKNILVTATGRVVILDFGLAGEVAADGIYESSSGRVSGTVAFMAPEQAAGEPLTAAADWYAYGVVLYVALFGHLPFTGTVGDVLRDKQFIDPPMNVEDAGTPRDLVNLCADLLSRQPARRPSADEVLRRLAVENTGEHSKAFSRSDCLIGREQHLRFLKDAHASVQAGRAVCVRVRGYSGVGKTSLIRAFLKSLPQADTLSFVGRCYEQELVPFKGFDGVVDALARYLHTVSPMELASVLPRDVAALSRLFPVLARGIGTGDVAAHDDREIRRRGLLALRELFTRLGDRRSVVIWIDDFQWSDTDSVQVIEQLLATPDPPRLLILITYREEDEKGAILQRLKALQDTAESANLQELVVSGLSFADTTTLLTELLGESPASAYLELAREAGGNPFFLGELAEAIQGGIALSDRMSFDRMLWHRSRALPPHARRLLDTAVIAGRPVPVDRLLDASGLPGEAREMLGVLMARHLLRMSGDSLMTVYHDRIREALQSHLAPEDRRQLHLCWAATEDADTEFRAIHFHAAGEEPQAAKFYREAAAVAATSTAFDQAARLYQYAIELGNWTTQERADLEYSRATALANAGQGLPAAEAYLRAADADPARSLEARNRAASQYLMSGHIDVGLQVHREVGTATGVVIPGSILSAVVRLIMVKARLWLRRIRYRVKPIGSMDAGDLQRLDLCWSATMGLVMSDFPRGAYVVNRATLLALSVGEPVRIGRCLALLAAHAATIGPQGNRTFERFMKAAHAIEAETNDPYLSAHIPMCYGFRDHLVGDFRSSYVLLETAEQRFLTRCTGVTWELDTTRTFAMWSLLYRGEFRDLESVWQRHMKDAVERGDLYAQVNFGTFIMSGIRTAADEPERALSELDSIMARWSQNGFHVQHHNALLARMTIFLYSGDSQAAWELVRSKRWDYHRSLIWQIQECRIDVLQFRARSALALARDDPRHVELLRSAERDAKRLKRETAAWGRAHGALIEACVARRRSSASATRLFAIAVEQLDAVGLGAVVAAARYRLGEGMPDESGREHRETAVRWLTERGVRNPLRLIDSLAPV
jgi:eukaryotic-like serine/threonine-protein kinase